jgi:hypothetical protein
MSKCSRYGCDCSRDSVQMAMAVLLREHLQQLAGPPLLFDPAFSETDVALVKSFGLGVIEENEQGRRAVQQPTFFYLAHCEVWDTLVDCPGCCGRVHGGRDTASRVACNLIAAG